MTASDIAYFILCYESGIDVWMEHFQMKQMNTAEKEAFTQTVTLKYHCPPGTKLKAYHNGLTQQGRDYYDERIIVVKGIKANKQLWEVMKKAGEHNSTKIRGVRLYILLLLWVVILEEMLKRRKCQRRRETTMSLTFLMMILKIRFG